MNATGVFQALESLLIERIPQVLASVPHAEPLCIVRIYYYDTHAPYTYLDFQTVSVSQRQSKLAAFQDSRPEGPLFYLWSPGERCGTHLRVAIPDDPAPPENDDDDDAVDLLDIDDEAELAAVIQNALDELDNADLTENSPDGEIKRLFGAVNKLLDYELLAQDSPPAMELFRSMLQSVTMQLNQLDWATICKVSDDFVIAPADGSRHFAQDEADLRGGIPDSKIRQLQSRGFLGPDSALLSALRN